MSLTATLLTIGGTVTVALAAIAFSITGSHRAGRTLAALAVIGALAGGITAAVLASRPKECRKITNAVGQQVCAESGKTSIFD